MRERFIKIIPDSNFIINIPKIFQWVWNQFL